MKAKSDFFISAFLFCLGFVSRVFLVEKFQSHWDGPLYSIGVVHYDLINSTPAIPGYPYYIGLGKLFNVFFNNPHVSLLFVSVLFSGIGAVTIFFLGKVLFNRTVGLISAVVLLSSPTFYFFGITTYGYIVLPTMVSLLALSVYKVYVNRKKSVFPALFFAMSLGFRPQEIFFNAPLYILSIYKQNFNNTLRAFIMVFIITLSWLIPLSLSAGGINEYIKLMLTATGNGQAFTGFRLLMEGHLYDVFILRIFRGIYLTLGVGLLVLVPYAIYFFINLVRKGKFRRFFTAKIFIFYAFWMLPSFLFNIFLRIEHAGYQFTYLVPLVILLSAIIWKLGKKNTNLIILLSCIVTVCNLYTFFKDRDPNYVKPYSPSSFHYSEIRKNDFKMSEKYAYITQNYNPKSTLIIVGTPEQFNPVAYHFKNYNVREPAALVTTDPRFVNIVRGAKDLNLSELKEYSRTFIVPSAINKVILFDDEFSKWGISNLSIINFPRNTSISVINVKSGDVYKYGYHTFKKE